MDPYTPYQPPITPGYQAPPTLPVPEPPAPRSLPRWVWPVLAGLVVLVLGAAGSAVYLATRTGAVDTLNPLAPKSTKLAVASAACGAGQLADGDNTLVLDMAGKDPGTGSLTVDNVMCVLKLLEMPSYVQAEMQTTRALDGRQTQSWGIFEASWKYHPDDGLDVIVRQIG